MTQVNLEIIYEELKTIKDELDYIKKHMIDIDSIMTEEDYEAIEKAREEKKQGKLSNLEEIEKELE